MIKVNGLAKLLPRLKSEKTLRRLQVGTKNTVDEVDLLKE